MFLKKRALKRLAIFLGIYLTIIVSIFLLFIVLVGDELFVGNKEEILPMLGFLLLFCSLPIVLTLVLLGLGKYTGSFDRYINSLSWAERERFERELQNGYQFRNIKLTSECLVTMELFRLEAIPYKELIWIYKSRQFIYFMQIRQLMFITADRKQHGTNLGKDFDSMAVDELIRRIAEKQPNVLVGSDEEKMKLYTKDFERMKLLAGYHMKK